MEQLKEYQNYHQYKAAVDTELQRTAESFVRIGYLLKVARDTDILQESGYTNVNDFAKGEYGIERTQVSRFININDRFSEGGFSDQLLPEYQGMGYAKLALMLTLPDSINEELTPEYTKTEIQAVKEEYEAEQSKTDIEVMLEGRNTDIERMDNDLQKAIYQLIHDNPNLLVEYIEMTAAAGRLGIEEIGDGDLYELLAPNEQAMYSIRLEGIGRMFLSIKDSNHITLMNVRTNEKQTFPVQEAREYLQNMIGNASKRPEDIWMTLFGEEFPVKEEPKVPETAERLNAKPISEPKKSKVIKAPEKPVQKNEKTAERLNEEAPKMNSENNAFEATGQQPDSEVIEQNQEEATGQQDE